MNQLEAILILTKETNHLPKSSFYLGLADILTESAKTEIKTNPKSISCTKTINEIRETFNHALELFSDDKIFYNQQQKSGFLERKICVKNKVQKLIDQQKNVARKIDLTLSQ